MLLTQPAPSSEQDAVHHPRFARLYERFSVQADARGGAAHRDRLLSAIRGRVVEVGAGNGLNFAHYPDSVSEVVAVEPEPYLRERAEQEAANAPVAVRVVPGVADALPLEDGSFDAGVASLVLCTVPDQERALAELYRVIRPGGELRFYEHVRSHGPLTGRVQQAADLIWPHVAGGCHMARDTASAIERAGFAIDSHERFGFRPSWSSPPIPHIIGIARRP
jgi:ubiquinone/menaquinone biosynthesis C-methylase UbiE